MSHKTPVTDEAVRAVLAQVQDPELKRDLVSLGMVKTIEHHDDNLRVEIELTTPACPLKHVIGDDVKKAIWDVWPELEVDINFSARVRHGGSGKAKGEREHIAGVKNVILVASGKGGVGKSTVAVNLAFALRELGASVGLADCDVYGPSLHVMLTPETMPHPAPDAQAMEPARAFGMPVVSMGYLIEPGQPVIWRGPMLSSAAMQLLKDVNWGSLDYLVVDLPPGTGDVQLSIAQKVQVSGAVIVSTPQAVALADVERAKSMFDRVNVKTLGVIENMSYFVCDGCNKRHEIFASGGAQEAAERLDVPFLGALPIDVAMRNGADAGTPLAVSNTDSTTFAAFKEIASQLAAHLAVMTEQAHEGGCAHLHVVQ